MKIQKTNIFIVDDDKLVLTALKNTIEEKFGDSVQVTTFKDGESCLKQTNDDIHIVILDYYLQDKNGLEVLKNLKTISPKIEVIMLTSNEDVLTAIEILRAGAKEFVVKGTGALSQVSQLVNSLITKRFKMLAMELRRSKYMAVFFIALTIVGLGVLWIMKIKK
jgi:DNA-binding NtrC family response regulator